MITRICKRHLVGLSFIICQLSFSVALLSSCSEANEYEDTNTNNPTWSENDSTKHPASLANTKYVRASGMKYNAMGQEIQGFVESVEFVSADSVKVTMKPGCTEGTWVDDSNTDKLPHYYYTYSATTGTVTIIKMVKDDKGKVSPSNIFLGTATSGKQELITIVHYGDTPVQTYLVKQ